MPMENKIIPEKTASKITMEKDIAVRTELAVLLEMASLEMALWFRVPWNRVSFGVTNASVDRTIHVPTARDWRERAWSAVSKAGPVISGACPVTSGARVIPAAPSVASKA